MASGKPASVFVHILVGWISCFVIAIFLCMFLLSDVYYGSFIEDLDLPSVGMFGFFSFIPGVFFGVMVYHVRTNSYYKEHPYGDGQPINNQPTNNQYVNPQYTNPRPQAPVNNGNPYSSSQQTKQCPYCGGTILAVARKCRYCGEWLDKN